MGYASLWPCRTEIDPGQKRVTDDKGGVFTYEKLLLATGGRPRRLPFGDDKIIYFRTLSDYRRLRSLTEAGRPFAVIGAVSSVRRSLRALTLNGKEVVMIFPGKDIERPSSASSRSVCIELLQTEGVQVFAGDKVVGLETRGKQHLLKTSTNRKSGGRRGGGESESSQR